MAKRDANGDIVGLGGAGGDVATDTLWDAKGDLAAGTGSDAAARLPVGANGHVLSADSAEATGLKWVSPSGAAFDISALTAETTVDLAADHFAMYDASASAMRKVLGSNLPYGKLATVNTWADWQTFAAGADIQLGYAQISHTGANRLYLGFYNSTLALNEKYWDVNTTADGKTFSLSAWNDGAVESRAWSATRSGAAITGIAYGNATNNPTHTFYGPTSLSSTLSVAGETALSGNLLGKVGAVTHARLVLSASYPYLQMDAEGDGGYVSVDLRRFASDGYGGGFDLYSSRGTIASPSAVQAGDDLGYFSWNARNGVSGYSCPALTTFMVESVTGSAITGRLVFQLGPSGASRVEAAYIHTDGSFVVGTPTGGEMGAGSINAEALYINGAAVGDGASSAALSAAILADSPMAYWKCNETSGTTLDNAQGTAAYDLTLSGSYTLAFTHLLPDSSEKYLYISGGYAGVSGDIGFTSPVTGDWTFECVLLPLDFGTLSIRMFTISAAGETEPTNYQIYCAITTSGELQVFWEYGAGVNVTNASGILMREGVKNHYAFVKDGTANTVTFFLDGSKVAVVSYANEPTGGTDATIVTRIGTDGTGGATGNFVIGHAAIWASALTEAQILSHARAAGRT